jgi:hypothetical protein
LTCEIYLKLAIGIELAHGPNVRFGSKADIPECPTDVCFTSQSGHRSPRLLHSFAPRRFRYFHDFTDRLRFQVAHSRCKLTADVI